MNQEIQYLYNGLTLNEELSRFYKKNGFGEEIGARKRTVPVYTGCMLVPMPNIETRHIYLKYHDIHHLVTGYSVGRIGEGQVSAWELGTGSMFNHPLLGIMNMIALSTGLLTMPKKMWIAFKIGCKSRNLYPRKKRKLVESGYWENVASIRAEILEVKSQIKFLPIRVIEFSFYSTVALIIHAFIAIPASIARICSDLAQGKEFSKLFKTIRREDLY